MDQYIGRLLDNRYEILEVIGTGGMAVVYKARCHRLNRLVAIKILKDEFSADEEFRRRFHAEGEAVAMLSHPNIVQVYDVSSSDNANYIVMELIDGISLKQYMEKKGVLNWKETLHFAMQIAKGLEHAHSRGIVHRDIKPHNIMVLKNGSVKVMDFGIARVMSKSNTLTKEALGSVHYISPEQAKGGYTDNRSDIYSLGVVMYEMMTGRPPYDGESPVAVAIQHINGGAPMPSTLNPNIPGGLEQIIMKSMALEVKDRYASATEMLQDMEEFRKNPAILFHYHTVVDDATRAIHVIPSGQPRTTAERVAQARGGAPVSTDSMRLRQQGTAAAGTAATARKRTSAAATGTSGSRNTGAVSTGRNTGSVSASRDPEAARRAQRRKEEQQRQEEERSRVATTAIVVCSAVAVIAIIVFLVALFNGALLNKEKKLVDVPYLVGAMYSESLANEYSDFTITLLPQEYSDSFPKGQIMAQEPSGGSKVYKGTEIYITVSMGEEPLEKVMENLAGVSEEEARSFLEGQGFKPLVRREASFVYDEGLVIRTDPSEGTTLTEGQTIKIWVSTGPEVVYAKMPNVMGKQEQDALDMLAAAGFHNVTVETVESNKDKGTVVAQSVNKGDEIDVTTEIILQISQGPEAKTVPMPDLAGKTEKEARAMLEAVGLTNVTVETVESNKEKGTVVYQSVAKGQEVDVTTKIYLEISSGPKETDAPSQTPDPTAPADSGPTKVTMKVTFTLPGKDSAYVLSIFQNGREITESVEIPAGETSFTVMLTGSGTQEYDLYIDGEFYQTQKVKFTDG